MASKLDWLRAGLSVVAEHGARALTIERLMGRLELSKGSFYHHFAGMADYVAQLAGLFEEEHTTRPVDAAERDGAAPDDVKLRRLIDSVTADYEGPDLEVNMRAWGQQDDVVGAMMRRVDTTRTDYLRTLCRGVAVDTAVADDVAELLCLIFVGGQHVLPAVPPERVRHHTELALRLLPGWTS